jgi:hypothetical protein
MEQHRQRVTVRSACRGREALGMEQHGQRESTVRSASRGREALGMEQHGQRESR